MGFQNTLFIQIANFHKVEKGRDITKSQNKEVNENGMSDLHFMLATYLLKPPHYLNSHSSNRNIIMYASIIFEDELKNGYCVKCSVVIENVGLN